MNARVSPWLSIASVALVAAAAFLTWWFVGVGGVLVPTGPPPFYPPM